MCLYCACNHFHTFGGWPINIYFLLVNVNSMHTYIASFLRPCKILPFILSPVGVQFAPQLVLARQCRSVVSSCDVIFQLWNVIVLKTILRCHRPCLEFWNVQNNVCCLCHLYGVKSYYSSCLVLPFPVYNKKEIWGNYMTLPVCNFGMVYHINNVSESHRKNIII